MIAAAGEGPLMPILPPFHQIQAVSSGYLVQFIGCLDQNSPRSKDGSRFTQLHALASHNSRDLFSDCDIEHSSFCRVAGLDAPGR